MAILQRLELPVSTAGDPDRIAPLMDQDKKRRDGRIRFAIPADIGCGVVVEVSAEQARAAVGHVAVGNQA
jgi:3-dehydroquinate synthetase